MAALTKKVTYTKSNIKQVVDILDRQKETKEKEYEFSNGRQFYRNVKRPA
jgi:hypothetical protein